MNIKILILFKVNGLNIYLQINMNFVVLEMMINQYIVGEVLKLKIFLNLIKFIREQKL